jgi:hypothetical protein
MRSLTRNKMQLKSYLCHREKRTLCLLKTNTVLLLQKTITSCLLLLVKVPYIFFAKIKMLRKTSLKKKYIDNKNAYIITFIYIYISTSNVVFYSAMESCFLRINKSLLVIDNMPSVVFTNYCY